MSEYTDSQRLHFLIDEQITIAAMNGTGSPMVYQCQWPDGFKQIYWYKSPIEAIDEAMENAEIKPEDTE